MKVTPIKMALTLIGIGFFIAMCYIVVDMAQMTHLRHGKSNKPIAPLAR